MFIYYFLNLKYTQDRDLFKEVAKSEKTDKISVL